MLELFRSDNVVVRSVPTSDTRRWVVTFDNYGIGHGFDRPGFGEEFLRNNGISAVHVMGVGDDWYQYPEMIAAMAAVRQAVAGAERVMTYGSSMGGYAALRFADAAGAHAVLAISPQYSVDPRKAPFEKRWLQDGRRIQWLPEIDGKLHCAVSPVVVFDPQVDDGRQVALIRKDIKISSIRLPYVSHPATTFLSEIGLLKPLVLQTLSGDINAATFTRQAREQRRKSSVYISNLAQAQPAHRSSVALSLGRLSVEMAPSNPLAGVALAQILSGAGQHDQAVCEMERVVKLAKNEPIYLIHYVNVLRAAQRPAEALPFARQVVEAWPQMAHIHAWEGAVLWESGAYLDAVAAVERAMSGDPECLRYRRTLKTYRRQMVGIKVGVTGPLNWVKRWSAGWLGTAARPSSRMR
ncbi:hypothetical protein [Brevundimonas diminuta]|uniref:hypothetical protein n=1 Tax=Brevundimonas diminuta TaxID=293 RepID=UPI003CFBE96E